MTSEELAAIKARAEAATPGPWEVERKDCTVLRAPNGPPSDQSLMGDEQYYPWTPDRIEDWQFIAHARTDVPQLVAEVERLRKALERLGSSEAFTYAMAINTDDPREEELRARLDFARDTMK